MEQLTRTDKSNFSVIKNSHRGRLGKLDVNVPVSTPYLFPVTFLVTGTTARGGAMWKYVLQADEEHGLLRRNLPILSQVLHFLDYGVSPNGLNTWRRESIRGLYNTQVSELDYQAPIFLDSGGFKLMWRTGLDLSRYGISLARDEEARSILRLQRDFGGDIVATLDYPLPPNLVQNEIPKRLDRSRRNAIQAAKLLREEDEFQSYNPFLFMAVHGLTPAAITDYIQRLFDDIEAEELQEHSFGLAIGSLVPLRISRKTTQIIKLIRAVVQAIPEKYVHKVPVHVFGVTGLLVPYLAYLGVDTFDSSTFAQEARSAKYILPTTYQRRKILEMSPQDIVCECRVCRDLDLHELQTALVSEISGKILPTGHFKSKYYADIALHNLELDLKILERTRTAIKDSALDEYVIELTKSLPRTEEALSALVEEDSELRRKASRVVNHFPESIRNSAPSNRPSISLAYTPDDFNINSNGYQPSTRKPILLLVPCSREKPYSRSHSHLYLNKHLDEALPGWSESVAKVTLSGLFGPVPHEYECHEVILHYDFRLTSNNRGQIELCTTRLIEFLRNHDDSFDHCVSYGTSNAYRLVFEKAARKYPRLVVLPEAPKSRTLREFFRKTNIAELVEYIHSSFAEP